MLRYLDTRFARILTALAIVAVLATIGASRVLYRTSVEAVLNAPRITLVAPVDGVVRSLGTRTGSLVDTGATIVDIERTAWSVGTETERGARRFILERRLAALATERRTLDSLRRTLMSRTQAYTRAMRQRLDADSVASAARLSERRRQHARLETLRRQDGATDIDVDRASADLAAAEAEHARARAAAQVAAHGVVLEPGGQDAPYSQQRADEVVLRLTAAAAEAAALRAEWRALGGSVPSADDDQSVPPRYALTSPSRAVVWSLDAVPGEPVLKGEPVATLIDCARLYFEATVSAREQEAIRIGAPVRIRFAGSSRLTTGRVALIRGGGVRPVTTDAAQLTLPRAPVDAHVIVDVEAEAVGATPENFCQVGRSAKIIFDGPTFGRAAGEPPGSLLPAGEAPAAGR